MMKYFKLFLLLMLCTIGLAGCDKATDPTHIPPKDQPKLNPHPQYFMTVKGHIAAPLKDKIHLTWIAEYQTNNPACEVTINEFEGVSVPMVIRHAISVKVDEKGNYLYKIPLDLYEPGRCQWGIVGLRYAYNQPFNPATAFVLVHFGSAGQKVKSLKNEAMQTMECTLQSCFISKWQGFSSGDDPSVDANNNYVYRVNFLYRG